MREQPLPITEHEDVAEAERLERLRRLAKLMDRQFPVPLLGGRFGLDGLLGLVPVVGDTVSWGVAGYIVAESRALGAPAPLVARMTGNIVFDWVVGLVPIVGDLADFTVKANSRNVTLLEQHLARRSRKA